MMSRKQQKYAIIILHSLLTAKEQNLHPSDIDIARKFLNLLDTRQLVVKK